MNQFLKILLVSIGIGFSAPGFTVQKNTLSHPLPHKTVGISQIVEHPALDAVHLGLLEALKQEGYVVGENLTVQFENAQGNMATATQIATKLLSEHLDVVVGISTPSAQTLLYAAKRNHKQVPLVFTAVSDPIAAKLEPYQSQYPITGITDSPNLSAMRDLMRRMIPHLKTVGFIYNSSEANSVTTIEQFEKLWAALNIKVVKMAVNKTSEVAQAMQSLLGKVDAVYFPQDNTVVSAIETVVNIAKENRQHGKKILPLFCHDPLLVNRGILAAVGYDYTEIGKETGLMVVKLLKGEKVDKLSIHSPSHLETVVNKSLAEGLGFTPQEIVDIESSNRIGSPL